MWKSQKVNERIKITEVFSLFEGCYMTDYVFTGESHDFWECVYVKKGLMRVSADERIYTLTSGDIIFHQPLEFHKFSIEGNEGADLVVFSFNATGELCDYFMDKVFSLDKFQSDIINLMINYCRKTADENQKGESLDFCRGMSYLYSVDDMQMVVSYIVQLLLSLSKTSPAPAEYESQEAQVFTKAVNYMKTATMENLSVQDIAEYCNVSRSGIKRVFLKFSGIGVHKYYLQLKVNAAASLLASGVSVCETSERLGFSSQAYFSAMFKRETGKSPSEYIRS